MRQSAGPGRSVPLKSTFAEDPDMADLVREFLASLEARVGAMSEAFTRQDATELRRLAHQLKGAGGGYGFAPISQAAGALEDRLRALDGSGRGDLSALRREMDALTDLCRRALAA